MPNPVLFGFLKIFGKVTDKIIETIQNGHTEKTGDQVKSSSQKKKPVLCKKTSKKEETETRRPESVIQRQQTFFQEVYAPQAAPERGNDRPPLLSKHSSFFFLQKQLKKFELREADSAVPSSESSENASSPAVFPHEKRVLNTAKRNAPASFFYLLYLGRSPANLRFFALPLFEFKISIKTAIKILNLFLKYHHSGKQGKV